MLLIKIWRRRGYQDGLAAEGACCQAWWPMFHPWNHTDEDWFLNIILWPSHKHHGILLSLHVQQMYKHQIVNLKYYLQRDVKEGGRGRRWGGGRGGGGKTRRRGGGLWWSIVNSTASGSPGEHSSRQACERLTVSAYLLLGLRGIISMKLRFQCLL